MNDWPEEMLIRGDALIDTITISFTISGSRGDWKITTTSGGITAEDETVERTWFLLFSEMLSTAFKSANRRRFPERTAVAASGAKR
jgi:hypothetical protein